MSHPHITPREPEWLAGIREGNAAAFEGVFRTYYRRLCGVVCAYVGSAETAEEIVQKLFLKIWRQRESLEITDSLQGYLFRAARNEALNHLKHQRVELQWRGGGENAETRGGPPPPDAPSGGEPRRPHRGPRA